MSRPVFAFVLLWAALVAALPAFSQSRPNLIITRPEAERMQAALGRYPLFDRTVEQAKVMVEEALRQPISVPVPLDAGGTTHERHKLNYAEMQAAGVLYAMSGDVRYAEFVKSMLLEYAKLYPALSTHPAAYSPAGSGRLFWQSLNETVWLVHVAQAYDCVYERLSAGDRITIEENLLRPMARFFVVEHARTFDRVHNHGTWMVSAVGMLGYALRDRNLVEMALYGTRKDSTGGFLRQLRDLFSPDGYYAEGPYYTRYAVMPFFLLAQAIDNNQPELRIFAYRDSILQKVLLAALQQTTPAGTFLPMNDALKEMSLAAKEIVTMLNIGYARCGGGHELLSIAAEQGRVMLSGSGLLVARDLSAGAPPPFPFKSLQLRDGPAGSRGGIGLLRSLNGTNSTLLVMKYAAQGMEHGHYDRLGILYYDQGREVLQDYGAVRFINVETKDGGRYLPENKTWAKQTIAHNTVCVDGRSHFDGNLELGERHPGSGRSFDAEDPDCQIMSASASGVAPGVHMQRTLLLVRDPRFAAPVVLDVFRLTGDTVHQYDMPFYYQGHLVNTTLKYTPHTKDRKQLGKKSGYQHLWVEASARAEDGVQWTWLLGGRYYSITAAAGPGTEVYFVRLGAEDPSFNLRPDPGVVIRRRASSCVFASVIEPHGEFEPVEEVSHQARPAIRKVNVLADTDQGTVVEILGGPDFRWRLMVANGEPSPDAEHTVTVDGRPCTWKGPASLIREVR